MHAVSTDPYYILQTRSAYYITQDLSLYIFVVAASKTLALSQKEPKMREGFLSSIILIALMVASFSGASILCSHPSAGPRPLWSSTHALKPATGSKEFYGYLDTINRTFKFPLQSIARENRVSSLAAIWETSMSRTNSLCSSATREEADQVFCLDHLCIWLNLILLDHSHHDGWIKDRAVCRSSWSLSYIIRGYLRVSQPKQFSKTWTR